MTHHPSSATSRSRRSVVGLLGAVTAAAVPLAGGSVLTTAGIASADSSVSPPRAVPVARDLLPGGDYERFVAQQAAAGRFSGNVLLAYQGRPVLHRSYGMANTATSAPHESDTNFYLASLTKMFTSVAIAQLVQQGKVAFHQTLGTYLSGFPAETANAVRVHHLLTHTSGLGRPALGSGEPEKWNSVQEVWDGTLALIRKLPLSFTPGTRYAYSNDGYFVLGAIVAQVTGQSYFDYVREHVFVPAGMKSTNFYTRPQVLDKKNVAHPYWSGQAGERADYTTSPYFPFTGGPADGAYSTTADLLGFAQALPAGRLLIPSFTNLITSGKFPLPETERASLSRQSLFYSYGFLDTVVNSQRVFGHSGNGPGAATNLDIFPDLGWVSVVLSNYDSPIEPIVEKGRQLVTRQSRP